MKLSGQSGKFTGNQASHPLTVQKVGQSDILQENLKDMKS